jgi:fido (protein-threonine AMPylation protein)
MKEDTTRPKGATRYNNTKMGIIPREALIKLETKGINQGLEYIQQIKSEKITPELILSIHEKSFGFIFDWAGKFRTQQVMIGMKEAPDFFDVPI